MKYFLSIAASDPSGGAGVQKDVKVAHDIGYWALSALTGIAVQDFDGVDLVRPVESDLLYQQIEKCLSSFPVHVVKIGVVCNSDNIDVIAGCLKKHRVEHVVLDPVMLSSDGSRLFKMDSIGTLVEMLLPLVDVITPNKSELEVLTGQPIGTLDEAIALAVTQCVDWKSAIVIKGGHFESQFIHEAIISGTKVIQFQRERLHFLYQHGTGCTFSSALACYLGLGYPLEKAYVMASEYLIGHFASLNKEFGFGDGQV